MDFAMENRAREAFSVDLSSAATSWIFFRRRASDLKSAAMISAAEVAYRPGIISDLP
jgi:hypothetical protein